MQEDIGLGMASRHPKTVVLFPRADVYEGDVDSRRAPKRRDHQRFEQTLECGRRVHDEVPLLDLVEVRERHGDAHRQYEGDNRECPTPHRRATPPSARPPPLPPTSRGPS